MSFLLPLLLLYITVRPCSSSRLLSSSRFKRLPEVACCTFLVPGPLDRILAAKFCASCSLSTVEMGTLQLQVFRAVRGPNSNPSPGLQRSAPAQEPEPPRNARSGFLAFKKRDAGLARRGAGEYPQPQILREVHRRILGLT